MKRSELIFTAILVPVDFLMLVFAIIGLYLMKRNNKLLEEFFRIVIATSAGLMVVIIYIFIKREFFDSRFLILGAWVLAVFFVSWGRLAVRALQRYLVGRYHFGSHNVVVVGGEGVSEEIIQ